jgi:anti-sigma regulatory factor (Ser/Thr protein kinase)
VAVLQVNTEALLDGLVAHTPEQTASLHEEVLRLGRMVEDLQTLAAAEAAALQLSRQPCDLARIAAAEAEEWDASFASAGVRFTRRLEPAPVLADPGRVHQVITNLLSNALKFTPPGGQVGMSLSASGGQARLEVSDTGPGISPEDQLHVFDRLWRGPGTTQTAGSGIGLAVAAELAQAHEGRIEVASEPGCGSRFTLVLPLAPATQPLAVAGQAQPVPAAQYRLHDPRGARVRFDLTAQVLHVGVDGALVALELVPAYPVDQLSTRVHPAGNRGQRHQDPPLGRGQLHVRAAHPYLAARLVDDQDPAAVAGGVRCGQRPAAPAPAG